VPCVGHRPSEPERQEQRPDGDVNRVQGERSEPRLTPPERVEPATHTLKHRQ
jgi:hypothetical protein